MYRIIPFFLFHIAFLLVNFFSPFRSFPILYVSHFLNEIVIILARCKRTCEAVMEEVHNSKHICWSTEKYSITFAEVYKMYEIRQGTGYRKMYTTLYKDLSCKAVNYSAKVFATNFASSFASEACNNFCSKCISSSMAASCAVGRLSGSSSSNQATRPVQ